MSDKEASEIPEVMSFVEVQERYNQFRANNPQFFEYLDAITQEYNEKLSQADAAVRRTGVSCGPFEVLNVRTTYDGEELYKMVGHETFLNLGGTIETVKKYGVDKNRFDLQAAGGVISENVVSRVRKTTPAYRTVKKLGV